MLGAYCPCTHSPRWEELTMLEAFIDAPLNFKGLTVFPVVAPGGPVLPYLLSPEILLVRNGKSELIDLTKEAPLPALRAGDFITINSKPHSGPTYEWPADPCQRLLRKRISFPIKVLVQGKTHSIHVRGDTLTAHALRRDGTQAELWSRPFQPSVQ